MKIVKNKFGDRQKTADYLQYKTASFIHLLLSDISSLVAVQLQSFTISASVSLSVRLSACLSVRLRISHKKLSYCRGTARPATTVKILSNAAHCTEITFENSEEDIHLDESSRLSE